MKLRDINTEVKWIRPCNYGRVSKLKEKKAHSNEVTENGQLCLFCKV